MENKEIERAWNQFDKFMNENGNESNSTSLSTYNSNATIFETGICKNCKKKDFFYTNNEIVCNICGIIQMSFFTHAHVQNFTSELSTYGKKPTVYPNDKTSKMLQIHEWKMWSNEEKNTYKLLTYTKNLCDQLNIPSVLFSNISNTVSNIMNAIKKSDGTKRARVKDGIILVCIEYVSKEQDYNISAIELAKRMNLDIKYISKAEKMVLDLLNMKNKNNKTNIDLQLNKNSILSTKHPYDYVENVINKKNLKIPFRVLENVKKLINLCEQNDILLDHTPLSIGVCCFYYILIMYSIPIELKLFSELYNLSVVTIIKTTNKLKQFESFIHENIQ